MMRRSRLVIFYFKEKFCDSHVSAIDTKSHLWDFQGVLKTLSKKCLWLYLTKFFIQTVKGSFISHIIVDHGALLTCIKLFFTSRKNSLFCMRRQVTCEMFISKAFWRPCRKNNISSYIWHKLFIQTVKCSFFSHITVDQSFYAALLTISYFLLWGKILCFARVGKSLARCLFPKRSEDLVEKIISAVIFDTNCSFKQ